MRDGCRAGVAGMRVLMLSDVYFPRINGVSTSIRAAIDGLIEAGHAVTLVAPEYGDAHAAWAKEFGPRFELVRLPSRIVPFDPEDRLPTRMAVRGALRTLARRDWDVLHVHTPFRAHQLGLWLRDAMGVPVVETYHTYFEPYVAHYLPWVPDAFGRWAARRLSRRQCDAVDHLIVPTDEMASVLQRYGVRTPWTVLPSAIEPGFAPGEGAAFRARQGIAADRPVLVTISRLAGEKHIGFLLQAVALVVRELPELLFVVAGEGPDASRLRALATRLGLDANVRFLGNLSRDGALQACYRAGDAFVFASPTETQGLVLAEAMALGVPIVSTAVMGTASVLRDARSAVVAPDDVDGFARCVLRVLRDRELRAALSAAGPRDALRWRADTLVPRLEDVYRRLANRRVA
jgi:glycosyltransferase involved in cell wall biosynthesis